MLVLVLFGSGREKPVNDDQKKGSPQVMIRVGLRAVFKTFQPQPHLWEGRIDRKFRRQSCLILCFPILDQSNISGDTQSFEPPTASVQAQFC